ncbi:hypothetical protein BS47DRAFT_1372260 [Hydnum rufescens UP504]|uniref:MICOS complex subunit MIC60 n=1 Tax=Hydnum rufescens UP504 TaxID=1448309 RepID=A0A9P6DTS1_9AGAM|nr:hypothetical protein BS47DRAFT_1372260 [Hydnum rufescens UP504]
MLPASRRAIARPVFRHGRSPGARMIIRRRFATEEAIETVKAGETPPSTAAASPRPTKKKQRGFVSRIALYSSLFGVVFYGGSTAIALSSERYHDFFVESVPLGEAIMDYAETQGWDDTTLFGLPRLAIDGTKGAYRFVEGAVSRTLGSQGYPTPSPASKESSTETGRPIVKRDTKPAPSPVWTSANRGAAGDSTPVPKRKTCSPVPSEPRSSTSEVKVYTTELPLGFEPPPGFSRPSKPKPVEVPLSASKPVTPRSPRPPPAPPLPLVAPAVAELSASEPVIAHIASSIDNLAGYLRDSPAGATAAAKDILDAAQADLEEKKKLEEQLDAQAQEYSKKLLQLEVDSQDKIDSQEEGYKAMIEEERQRILQTYKARLVAELETQSQIINERLKEEVIAQGIEMQRRWIREIKVRVEQERGGRLAKLDDLATGLKRLERVALDNTSYLDENLRLHTLCAVDSPIRKPFREELRVLRHVAAARDEPIIIAALDSIERTDVPDIGVEPLTDLVSWFTTSVAPRVESVALLPDQNAGLLAHLASSVLSTLRFKRHGLVEGTDVSSVLARAEHFLLEKDLDSAARELNQLRGVPKVLLVDWLSAARKRLEVEQALAIIHSQATLSSLLVV